MFELFVAKRYLRARRKQVVISFITVISILGIMTGVAALIIILSMYSGMSQSIQNKLLGATSHITVQSTAENGIENYKDIIKEIKRIPQVTWAAPAIYVQVLLSSSGAASGGILKGINPEREKEIAGLFSTFSKGDLKSLNGGRNVILGRDLALKLGIHPGSMITIIVPRGTLSPIGIVPRVRRFRVVGTFETGLYDLDSAWGYISLESARKLKGIPESAVSTIEVRIKDIYNVEKIQKHIQHIVGDIGETTNWIERNKPLFSALKLEKFGMFLAIGLIVLVAALNIVTTLIMMVMEKNKDIAILQAMGATGKQIMRIFSLQGLIIGLIGTILGNIIGITLAWSCNRYKWIHLNAQVYSFNYLPFNIRPTDVVIVSIFAMLITWIATVYPSKQAVKIDPVEVIRYE